MKDAGYDPKAGYGDMGGYGDKGGYGKKDDHGCGCSSGGTQAIGQSAWNKQDADASANAFQLWASNNNSPVRIGSAGNTGNGDPDQCGAGVLARREPQRAQAGGHADSSDPDDHGRRPLPDRARGRRFPVDLVAPTALRSARRPAADETGSDGSQADAVDWLLSRCAGPGTGGDSCGPRGRVSAQTPRRPRGSTPRPDAAPESRGASPGAARADARRRRQRSGPRCARRTPPAAAPRRPPPRGAHPPAAPRRAPPGAAASPRPRTRGGPRAARAAAGARARGRASERARRAATARARGPPSHAATPVARAGAPRPRPLRAGQTPRPARPTRRCSPRRSRSAPWRSPASASSTASAAKRGWHERVRRSSSRCSRLRRAWPRPPRRTRRRSSAHVQRLANCAALVHGAGAAGLDSSPPATRQSGCVDGTLTQDTRRQPAGLHRDATGRTPCRAGDDQARPDAARSSPTRRPTGRPTTPAGTRARSTFRFDGSDATSGIDGCAGPTTADPDDGAATIAALPRPAPGTRVARIPAPLRRDAARHRRARRDAATAVGSRWPAGRGGGHRPHAGRGGAPSTALTAAGTGLPTSGPQRRPLPLRRHARRRGREHRDARAGRGAGPSPARSGQARAGRGAAAPALDPVRSARYYNVQLLRDGRKILSAWPRRAKLQLKRRGGSAGGAIASSRGEYHWFVWPGKGPRAEHEYGERIGARSFVVARMSVRRAPTRRARRANPPASAPASSRRRTGTRAARGPAGARLERELLDVAGGRLGGHGAGRPAGERRDRGALADVLVDRDGVGAGVGAGDRDALVGRRAPRGA